MRLYSDKKSRWDLNKPETWERCSDNSSGVKDGNLLSGVLPAGGVNEWSVVIDARDVLPKVWRKGQTKVKGKVKNRVKVKLKLKEIVKVMIKL